MRRKNVTVKTDPEQDFYDSVTMAGRWKEEQAPLQWDIHPEQAFRQNEFMQILHQCLGILPERVASVFVLREIEGQESEEICKELGLSTSNLRVILHRTRTQLRRCLERNWFGKNRKRNL